MNNNHSSVWTGGLCLLLAVACGGGGAAPPPAGDPAAAYFRFVAARQLRPLDFARLEEIYRTSLRAYLRAVEGLGGGPLQSRVEKALAAGQGGKNPRGNAQTAEKTIQYAFFLEFTRGLDSLLAGGDSDVVSDLVGAASVLRATADRRGRWIGRGEELGGVFDRLREKIRNAAAAGDEPALSVARLEMTDFLSGVYLLSVLYELEGLENARGGDFDLAAEKLAEARGFYLFIQDRHREQNPAGERSVRENLVQAPEGIDIELARAILKQDFARQLSLLVPGTENR